MKNTKIICGFPGVGKTTMVKLSELNVLDSDSSNYSWVKDSNGNNTNVRNPEFPGNYINHIKEDMGKVDIILVSTHKQVRDALKENNIEYTLVYPKRDCKSKYLERYKERNSPESFIKSIDERWDMFIDQCEEDTYNKIELCYTLNLIDLFTRNGILRIIHLLDYGTSINLFNCKLTKGSGSWKTLYRVRGNNGEYNSFFVGVGESLEPVLNKICEHENI